jgi:glycosyltransferase involved in cell wall biosynthesis
MTSRPDIAVILCTYNPDPGIFSQVLDGLSASKFRRGSNAEFLIVDNRSPVPIRTFAPVLEFQKKIPGVRIIHELRQGLLYARMAGAEATRAPILLFMDDDMIPGADYLPIILGQFGQSSRLGIIGAGHVAVEFSSPVWFARMRRLEKIFYGRHGGSRVQKTEQFFSGSQDPFFGRVRHWLRSWPLEKPFPLGAGMAIRRQTFDSFVAELEPNDPPVVGRQPQRLGGAEDLLMVLSALKQDWYVDIHPGLKLTHCIPPARLIGAYIHRLSYTSSYDCLQALIATLPGRRDELVVEFSRAPKWFIRLTVAMIRDLVSTPGLFPYAASALGIIAAAQKENVGSRLSAGTLAQRLHWESGSEMDENKPEETPNP